jgi:hypothetical protein
MRRFAPIILILVLAVFSTSAQEPSEESYIRLQATLVSSSLNPGDSTEILLKFAPADDFHLIADPVVNIDLDSLSVLRKAGGLRVEVDRRSGYIRTSHPLRQPVVLSRGIPPGTYPVQAKVTYFYCSGSKGWCRKQVQALKLEVSARSPSPPVQGG